MKGYHPLVHFSYTFIFISFFTIFHLWVVNRMLSQLTQTCGLKRVVMASFLSFNIKGKENGKLIMRASISYTLYY